MKIYLPAYDKGMAWEDHSVLYSKNAYTSYEEAEKEILARSMKISENQRDHSKTFYDIDIEKARESHEQYYLENPDESYEPFHDDDPWIHEQSAYIVTLELEEVFNSNQFNQNDDPYM